MTVEPKRDVIRLSTESDSREITPMSMLDRAVASGASIETLTKLMELQERWERNQARKAFDEAMSAAKSEIGPIYRNRTVSHGQGKASYRHADLAEIDRAITPILSQHGLSHRFKTDVQGNSIVVTCRIAHRDGHIEETSLPGPSDTSGAKNAIQAIGSTVTYLSRYTLMAALGLAASDDDDGRSVGRGETISDEQVQEINQRLLKTKSNLDIFLEVVGAASIPSMTVEQFNLGMRKLDKKEKQA